MGWELIAIIAALAVAGGSAVQAEDQRRRQQHFQERQALQQKKIAAEQARLAAAEIALQQSADEEQAAIEIETNRRSAATAKAVATVTAGEIGAFGQSYEALLSDFARQQSEFEGAVQFNLAVRNQQASLGLQGVELGRQTAIANTAWSPIPRPDYSNYVALGINVYGGVSSAAAAGKQPK